MKLFNNKGYALIGGIAICAIMTITAVGLVNVVMNEVENEEMAYKNDQSFLAAESGLMLGALWVNDSLVWANLHHVAVGVEIQDIVPKLVINGYPVQVNILKLDSCVTINATAQSSGEINYNKMVSQDADKNPPFDTTAFDLTMYSDGVFDFGGCGDISSPDGSPAKVHSNNEIIVRGDAKGKMDISSSVQITVPTNATIEGSGIAPVFDMHAQAKFTEGITVADVPKVPFPEIPLEPWYKVALANGEVHKGPFVLTKSYTPKGGILWVDGDVDLSGSKSVAFNGQIIATGNVKIGGQMSITAPEGGFAIATENGNIYNSTTGTIKGLIYAKNGDYEQTGNGNVEGQFIINGSISKGGNSDVVVYKKYIPVNPNPGDNDGGRLVAGSWNEINVIP
jgi:hypothetical protein